MDIIKSGGYKISALDIEGHLLTHGDVREAVVLGVPDPVYGQRVAAILTLRDGAQLTPDKLRTWSLDHLPKYQVNPHFTEACFSA